MIKVTHKLKTAVVIAIILAFVVPTGFCIAGHFALAFQRKLPAWENNAGTGCFGGRATRVWVWDEQGNPVPNIQLKTSWGILMGETDTDGRCQINYNTGIGFDLVCFDGTGSTSDVAYLMTSEIEPCRNFHSYEVGYLYKTDISNPGTFDISLHCTWPEMHGYCDEAPYTKSLAYNGVDCTDYWSDQSYWGNWQNPPSYFGQTFVATGNRVVAARVQGTIGGNDLLDWKLQIVTFPGLQPVGPVSSVPVRFPFGWEAFWGVNDCPVVPGRTYMLQVWRDPGGMNIWHVTRDVYPDGQYYEGTTALPQFDLNGHVCCMNYGSAAVSDFNMDGQINLTDFCKLAQYWLQDESSVDIAPPSGDRMVDFKDLGVLAEHWLTFPGVLAHWRLDETEGNIAHDSAGNNDATVYNAPVWHPAGGKIDGALEFDGLNDYVSTPFVLNPADGPLSIFTWIKGGQPGQVIVSQTNGSGLGRSWLCTDANGKFMTWLTQPGRIQPPLISNFVITDGDWHYIALVWDGSYRHLYADKKEVATDAVSLIGVEASDGGLYLGAGNTLATGSFWSGLLDDVRIYDAVINP